MDGSEDLPFCATTYDMDADNRWGFCKFQGNVRITIIVRQFLISLFFLLGVCGKCELRFDFVLMSRSKILLFEKIQSLAQPNVFHYFLVIFYNF